MTRPCKPPTTELSKREMQVLRLINRGLRNEDVAKTLCLSRGTVSTYRTYIVRKFGLPDGCTTVQIVDVARAKGLVSAPYGETR